ncbi:MAG TPA: hypothetical protein VGC85_10635 [Chthoniobacterales bacterium]|jgi:hypothetical protein
MKTMSRLLVGVFVCSTLGAFAQPPPPGQEATPTAAQSAGADVVDFKALLPILPEPPEGWKAEDAEGSTDDLGNAQISSVHRDYTKNEGGDAPTTSISILDSVASPEYVESTTAGWKLNETTAEGYAKPVNIDGSPGFETWEKEDKHGTLWLLVAKRYFLQIETTGQDPQALQEWLKRVDVKKLGATK